MYCPRLDHFARLNQDGSVGKCGHMDKSPGFNSMEDMERSEWLLGIKKQMAEEKWPSECRRCQRTEESGGKSIRQSSIDRHRVLEPLKKDYLIVGGVLDNICNSACQTCSAKLSTKIGSLEDKKNYPRIDNYVKFWQLPQERIVELDVNGGEPTASRNYKKILKNLPSSVKIVRMNTNGSRIIDEVEQTLRQGIKMIITMSLDGIGPIHDYVRWPVKWDRYQKTLQYYLELQSTYKLLDIDTWTTVSCLNISNLTEIIKFTKEKNIQHNWAFLEQPKVLNVRYSNILTDPYKHLFPEQVSIDYNNNDSLFEFINRQDLLRGIDHRDYLSFLPNFPKNNSAKRL